ncbi:MAG: OmpA family protein, partial [Flavobacteriales bacterium]
DLAFKNESYFSAIDLYKKAYTKEPSKSKKAEILFRIAECYRFIVDIKQAETWYKKAIKAKYPDPICYYHLGDALKAQEKYEDALEKYNKFLKEKPDDPLGKMGAESCKLAKEWLDNPTRHRVDNLVMINSKQYDFSPTFGDKKYKSLIFTSTREGSTGSTADDRTGESFSDLYISQVDKKGKWSVPTPLNEEINSASNEGSATLNKRCNTMYFTRCEFEKKKSLTCKILKAKKMGQKWGVPEDLQLGNDSVTVGHPSISKDDKYLFFASDMEGGQGGKDIWYVKYDRKAKSWSSPVNLGPEVNTQWDEMFPFIRADGTLFFASNGYPGLGGLDIFKAEKKGDNKWGDVENLKSPINSSGNDFGIIFEGKKEKGYLTSNRKGGKGGDDIYSFFVPPLIFTLQGTVTNLETKEPLPGAKLVMVGTDGSSVQTTTDDNGFYSFEEVPGTHERYIKAETTYNMVVSKEKFLNAKGQETTVGIEESTTFIHDFALQPFAEEIRFPAVLYAYDKYDLLPQSEDSLDFLYQTLIDNGNIVIELSAHTDSRGSNSYNEKLSQKRAEACVNYLIGKGIPADRMVPVGYGERKLLITDAQIKKLKTEEEQEAAHQKNRRTVFKILRDDYVPHDDGTSNESN